MNDHELEARLRGFYRGEVGEGETAPLALRRDVAAIPRTIPRPARWFGRGRGLTLLAAAALLLVGGAMAAGSGLVKLPSVVPPVPAPSPAAVVASPTVGPTSTSMTASPAPSATSAVIPPGAASWLATGSMTTPRMGHVAVLLRDGRVLVAGGSNMKCYCGGIVYYASAELYDPATGAWTATGSMVEPHAYTFTLTQLADGRVLAAGWPTSQLYDPSTGTWTATGKMLADDASANATLLRDGRVLVAGGGGGGSVTCNGCAPRSSAELYDPATGTWAAAANMTRPRSAPTATLLPNGKVLVAGGDPPADQPGPPGPGTAELFDPVTGSWAATGSMAASALVHFAVLLLNGEVLAVGLTPSNAPSAELYDPASGTWTVTGTMVGQVYPRSATLLPDGTVLVLGESAAGADTAELYDPRTGTWTAVQQPPLESNMFYTATLLSDGRMLVAGGGLPAATGSASDAIAGAELYKPGGGG